MVSDIQHGQGVLAGDTRMLIDGELFDAGAMFDVINPATEQVAGVASDGTVVDLDRAIAAARRAFEATEWRHDVEFRHHCLAQLQQALSEESERLRRIVVTEVGCWVSATGSQIDDPIAEIGHWADYGLVWPSTTYRTPGCMTPGAVPPAACCTTTRSAWWVPSRRGMRRYT